MQIELCGIYYTRHGKGLVLNEQWNSSYMEDMARTPQRRNPNNLDRDFLILIFPSSFTSPIPSTFFLSFYMYLVLSSTINLSANI